MHIENNVKEILENIEKACVKSDRDPKEVTLIAVSKTKTISQMEEVLRAGIINVGENKVQEIRDKYEVLANKFIWHMIGHLQTNKVKYIIDKVSCIHSVDSIKLAKTINDEAIKKNIVVNILIQVNIADEETKYGITPNEVENFIKSINNFTNTRIKGLMTVAPFVDNPEDNRVVFRHLKEIYVDINQKNIDNVCMDVLSMGMTNDYMVAIEEGATMVRVGTAIFGKRNNAKG